MSTVPHTVIPQINFPSDLINPDDPRLKHRIMPWTGDPTDVAIIGVPFDDGIALNGGRVGAAKGPTAFRKALLRFGTTYDAVRGVSFDNLSIADAGDLDIVPGDPAATHERLALAIAKILDTGAIPIVIGGGNDATYGSAKGLALTYENIGGVNIDAHLDMREVIDGVCHSGTPYRRIIEELGVTGRHLVELGLHSAVNSEDHMRYATDNQVGCWGLESLRAIGSKILINGQLNRLANLTDAQFVSFDLDVFASTYAPGVSAPGVEGLTAEEGRGMAFIAGRHANSKTGVKLFELMELSPKYDIDDKTARLAVLLMHAFLSGIASKQDRE